MRTLINSRHPDDDKDMVYEQRQLRAVNALLLANNLNIEVPDCRYWEYGTVLMMIKTLEYWRSTIDTTFLDVGSGHGLMCPALSYLFNMNVTECEPSDYQHRVQTNEFLKASGAPEIRVFPVSTDNLPDEQFDMVSCISVIEHMTADIEQRCWKNLVDRVKPGGLLFIDVDCIPDPSRGYVFDNLRVHNFVLPELKERVELLMSYGMQPIGEPDYNWNGAQVHDFSFFRIGMRKGK
jgi:SAM-dependent methyltransferase